MKIFFDILLYITCISTIIYFTMALRSFPRRVANIDTANNKKGKPLAKFMSDSLVKIELKTALPIIIFFAVTLVSYFCGSAPKSSEKPNDIIIIFIVLIVIMMFLGGMALGGYFLNIARKYNIYRKDDDFINQRVIVGGQFGVGVLITFYFSLILIFTFSHLFYICGWL